MARAPAAKMSSVNQLFSHVSTEDLEGLIGGEPQRLTPRLGRYANLAETQSFMKSASQAAYKRDCQAKVKRGQ
jgi:hypothetical protein